MHGNSKNEIKKTGGLQRKVNMEKSDACNGHEINK